MHDHFKHSRPWLIIPLFFGGIIIAIILAFIFGYFVMILWNWLMPVIFGLAKITFWQAWGLILLAHILFKFNPIHHAHKHHKYKHFDRDKFRERFKEKFSDKTDEAQE